MGNLRRISACILVIVGIVASAFSQVNRTYTSLESKVGEAESVYRGTIIDISRPKGVPISIEASTGHGETFELTVKVDETIKGRTAQTLTLGIKTIVPLACYQAYAREKTSFIWFINAGDAPVEWNDSWVLRGYTPKALSSKNTGPATKRFWESQRLGLDVPEHLGFSDGDGMSVFTMDFKVLTSEQDIIACARVFAKRHPKVVKSIQFEIPQWVGNWCGRPADRNSLYAPVVPELEKVGQWLAVSPSILLERTSVSAPDLTQNNEESLRLMGIHILRNFKSAKNQELLKKFLDDSTFTVLDQKVKIYRVRQAAFDVLKSWGTKVLKPVIEEKLP